MIDQAKLAFERGLGYALSTFADDGPPLAREERLRRIADVRPIPNRKLAVTDAARLRAIGCELEADVLPGHVRVVLGSEPDPKLVQAFTDVFGPAEDNPAYRETRR